MSRRKSSNSNAYLILALALIFGTGFLYFNQISPKVLSDHDEIIGFDEDTIKGTPTPTTSASPTPTGITTPIPEPTFTIPDEPISDADKEPIDFFNRPFEELSSLYKSASSTVASQFGINSSEEIKLKKTIILTEVRYQKMLEQIGTTINQNRDKYTPEKLQTLLTQYNDLKVNLDGFEKALETIESGQDLNATVNGIKGNSEAMRKQIQALINNLGVE